MTQVNHGVSAKAKTIVIELCIQKMNTNTITTKNVIHESQVNTLLRAKESRYVGHYRAFQ